MRAERNFPRCVITEKGARWVEGGHPWIYEAEVLQCPEAENGSLVDAVSEKGRYLGTGFLSRESKIRVRLVSRNANDRFDEAFWRRRIRYAWDYRKAVMDGDLGCCRVIFGEADGFPGLTVDRFSDLLVAMGGSTVLTEVPEMFGAESFLLDRCVSDAVFQKASDMLNGFKNYFIRHGEVVYDNPSPCNKQGGITTLEDKSCGCVQKGGSAPIVDVIGYAEPVTKKGLNLLYGPGNDLVSATALTAAGAHLILFTTGRGTPFGAPAPTMKIATNTPLATKKSNWIDFNAGRVADGVITLDEAGAELLDKVIRVASGEPTCAERKGFREISIFKDGVVL